MAVKFFKNRGPDDSYGNEHGCVSDYVKPCGALFRIIEKIYKRNKIYSERQNFIKAEKQGLDFAFNFFKRKKRDAHYYHYADINEQKPEFTFEIEFFADEAANHPEKHPDKGHKNGSAYKRYFGHCHSFLKSFR